MGDESNAQSVVAQALSILNRNRASLLAVGAAAVWYARSVRHAHIIVPHSESFAARRTRRIAEGCRRLWQRYVPFVLDDGFLQTVLAFFWRPVYVRRPKPTHSQVLFTSDGGALSLVWFEPEEARPGAPVVFLCPGNLGGWFAPYLRRVLKIMPLRGWRCVVFVRRGADGNDLRCGGCRRKLRPPPPLPRSHPRMPRIPQQPAAPALFGHARL